MKESNTQQRLLFLIKERNLKQKDILDATKKLSLKYNVKFNKSDISQYVSGKTEPQQTKLYILAKALKVDITWLMGFNVPMEKNNFEELSNIYLSEEEEELIKNYRKLNKEGQEKILESTEDLTELTKYKKCNIIGMDKKEA